MAAFAAGESGYSGLHHRGGGGRGCAQRHADGGGERRPLRPEPAAPAARPGGPRQRQELLRPALATYQNDETRRRLKALTQTSDGFRIAEEDLKLRGPGDFFGSRQHGLPTLKAADLSCDMPPAGRGPGCRAAAAGRRPAADPAGARRAPPPGAGPVPAKGRHSELKQGTLSALEMPAISSGAGTIVPAPLLSAVSAPFARRHGADIPPEMKKEQPFGCSFSLPKTATRSAVALPVVVCCRVKGGIPDRGVARTEGGDSIRAQLYCTPACPVCQTFFLIFCSG